MSRSGSDPSYTIPIARSLLFSYIIAFLEGGAVMATELISGKLIAPFYGNSLFVWTSVIGCTLGGLAVGYYLGGRLSLRDNPKKTLTWVLLLSTALLVAMPPLGRAVMSATLSLSVQSGSLLSCLLFIVPVLICFGAVSPLLISLTASKKDAGRRAGAIYGISTIGGVLATFIMGFYLIPFTGLKMSSYFSAMCVGTAALLSLIHTSTDPHKS